MASFERSASTTAAEKQAAEAVAALVKEPWHVIVAKTRIDSFNQDQLVSEAKHAREAGHKFIALDLHATRFLSLSAIRFLVQFALELSESGRHFALLKPSEKTQRHFSIYGSLAHVHIFKTAESLNIATVVELGMASDHTGKFSEGTIPLPPQDSMT